MGEKVCERIKMEKRKVRTDRERESLKWEKRTELADLFVLPRPAESWQISLGFRRKTYTHWAGRVGKTASTPRSEHLVRRWSVFQQKNTESINPIYEIQ